MTTPRRDDDLPLRDPRFDAAWQSASRDEPPPALDAAILAAARREVGAGPQRAGAQPATHARKQWWELAAAATLGAIAIGVLQLVTPDDLGAPAADRTKVTDMPAPVAAPPPEVAIPAQQVAMAPPQGEAPQPRVAAPPTEAGAPPPQVATPPPQPRVPPPQVADSAPAPAPAAAQPAQHKEERAATLAVTMPEPFPAATPSRDAATGDTRALGKLAATPETASPPPATAAATRGVPAGEALRPAPSTKVAAGRADEAAAMPMRAPESRENDRPPLPIADWIALIRRLREEGKPDAAAKELAAFRAAHADHERLLPPDLRDWRPPPK